MERIRRTRSSSGTSLNRSRRLGFTLVELLVVIGIIALLISILLPSLNNARRQARTVKCMANMRQIGAAFYMYAQTYKGYWPVAVHSVTATHIRVADERRWSDLLSEFLSGSGSGMSTHTDVARDRRNSVLWGCPEWGYSDDFVEGDINQILRNGYGMYYRPFFWTDTPEQRAKNLAYVNAGNIGRYLKQSEWTRGNSSARGIVADSTYHVIEAPGVFSRTATWQPFDPPAGSFYADARRHARPDLEKHASYTRRTINQLFCDGHVETVSVREAWNAFVNPGEDRAGP